MTDTETPPQLTPVAVLFVDISGSTTLYEQRGDAVAFNLTIACLDLVGARIRAAGGRVLRQLGDGALAVFDAPAQALQAAIDVSQAVEDPAGGFVREGVRVRSGISYGPAVLLADDVYGDVVNVAARLVGRASAGEIFLSGQVYELLPLELRFTGQLIDQMLLRNKQTAVAVYKYVPHDRRATVRARGPRRVSSASMEVAHRDVRYVIAADRPRVSIGRDAENDICIDDELVSRNHAEIVLRGDRFLLIDRSINGTYVRSDNGPVLRVIREELVLAAAGRIFLGAEESLQPIVYRVAAA